MEFIASYAFALIACTLIIYVFGERNLKLTVFLISVVVAVSVFSLRPKTGIYIDLVRFNQDLNISRYALETGGFHQSAIWWSTLSEYKDLPLVWMYLLMVSVLPSNGFLPSITVFIFMSLFGGVVKLFCSNFGYSKLKLWIAYMFLLTVFNITAVAGGVRNFLAFMLVVYGCVLWFMAKKSRYKVLKVLVIFTMAVLMHPSSLIFIVLFLISLIQKNKKLRITSYGLLLLNNLFIPAILQIIGSHSYIGYLNTVNYKMQQYVVSGTNYSSHSSLTEIITSWTGLSVTMLVYIICLRHMTKESKAVLEHYFWLVNDCLCFTLGSIVNTQLFLRSAYMLIFIVAPLIIGLNINKESRLSNNKALLTNTALLSMIFIGMFLLWAFDIYQKVFSL